MKCRICLNQITKRNRSPLKGVCKQDFRILSPETFADISGNDPADRPLRLKNSTNDVTPDVSVEFRERYLQSFRPPSDEPWVLELSPEDRRLLTHLRVKKAKAIREAFLDESRLNPALGVAVPEGPKEGSVTLELSPKDIQLVAEIRARRRFGIPSPVAAGPMFVKSAASVKTWEDCFSFIDYCLWRAPVKKGQDVIVTD